MKTIQLLAPAALAASLILSLPAALAADAAKGKTAYEKNGCWQCHGLVGQGGIAGPKLAPDPKPMAFYTAFVRKSGGAMPPYSETILAPADLADIHAYLQSIRKGADYKSIPLLNN